eukprot:contig_26600_g6534
MPKISDGVKRRWPVDASLQWVSRWVSSHRRQLRWRSCKALADKRAGPQVFKDVQGFCEQLSLFLETHSFQPDAVFNFYETRVGMRGGRMTTRRVEARDKVLSNIRTTCDNTLASLLTFVAASGTVFFSVYVLKRRFGKEDSADVNFSLYEAPQASRRSWRRFYCWTETGYLNGVTFRKVIEEFTREWGVRNPGREALLFGDQLGCHKEVETIQTALDKGV